MERFEVDREQSGAVEVFAVRGELDRATAPRLRQALEDAMDTRESSILIDLSSCGFLDSTGIGVLVDTWRRLSEAAAGSLALCCAGPEVRRVLALTGLDQTIAVHSARDEALAALAV
jgi:anti-anti-sigma factor